MITDLFDTAIAKVLALFSVSPGSRFSRKELQEKTFLRNNQLDAALSALVASFVLVKEKRMYSVNFGSAQALQVVELLKKEHGVVFRGIPLAVYNILVDVSASCCSLPAVMQISLFGSYAKVVYTDRSDVDLACILETESKETKTTIRKSLAKLEKRYGKVIEVHFFAAKDFRTRKDALIDEIKKNGIALFSRA